MPSWVPDSWCLMNPFNIFLEVFPFNEFLIPAEDQTWLGGKKCDLWCLMPDNPLNRFLKTFPFNEFFIPAEDQVAKNAFFVAWCLIILCLFLHMHNISVLREAHWVPLLFTVRSHAYYIILYYIIARFIAKSMHFSIYIVKSNAFDFLKQIQRLVLYRENSIHFVFKTNAFLEVKFNTYWPHAK